MKLESDKGLLNKHNTLAVAEVPNSMPLHVHVRVFMRVYSLHTTTHQTYDDTQLTSRCALAAVSCSTEVCSCVTWPDHELVSRFAAARSS